MYFYPVNMIFQAPHATTTPPPIQPASNLTLNCGLSNLFVFYALQSFSAGKLLHSIDRNMVNVLINKLELPLELNSPESATNMNLSQNNF